MIDFDHIAIAGESLDAATAHVEEALGVALQPGGQHQVYGTHNRLLGLADGLYLEAIAADPDAAPERSPRWFDLDRFSGAPRICNWICRAEDLNTVLARCPDGTGTPVALTRGDLKWEMAVPDDGILPFDNIFPALIQWHSSHPAPLLEQKGVTLRRLTLVHPKHFDLADRIAVMFLGDDRVRIEYGDMPGFRAEFDTPHGARVLR